MKENLQSDVDSGESEPSNESLRRRPKRPRIGTAKAKGIVVNDYQSYKSNLASNHTLNVMEGNASMVFKVDCDKHYFLQTLGRNGIGIESVKELVRLSLSHIIFYAGAWPGFAFINHNVGQKAPNRKVFILKKRIDDGMLNVVVEAHSVSMSECELTVTTAMVVDDFRQADGQYAIEIIDFDQSVLTKNENGKIITCIEL